jgi:hypothetical protein
MNEFGYNELSEIEELEQQLNAVPRPMAARDAMERTKLAIRAELHAMHGTGHVPRGRAWQGAVAAAAMIALAVGVGWNSLRQETRLAAEGADAIALWSEPTHEQVVQLASLNDQMTKLESWSAEESWNVNGATLYSVFEEAGQDDAKEVPADKGTSS